MAYHVTVLSSTEREARIQQSVDATDRYEDFWGFRGAKAVLPVVRLPIELPVYRMLNFRTFSDQAEYLARANKPADYFRSGQENESVQQVQHEILARLAATGKANSVVPVIDVLQREGQRESLLVSSSGVIINGNRRLAGMRELYDADSGAYPQFSHVDCKVLPADATPAEILEIEGILQGMPETRLDYDWVGDAQLISALLKIKGTPEAVAKVLGRRPAEIKNSLQALAEADLYLKDWANAKGEYSRVVETGEQLFKDIPGQLQGKPEHLKDASRAIAWTLFENGGKLDGRLYNYNVAFGRRAEDVLDQVARDLGVSLTTPRVTAEGDYDFDIGEDSAVCNYTPLITALREGPRRNEAIDVLIGVSTSVIESEKDKKSANAALKAITTANSKLAEVDISRAARSTYASMERQLVSVITRANDLLEKLRSIPEGDGVMTETGRDL